MLIIHFHIILWNIGIQISTNIIIPFLIGGLFFYIGTFLKKCKRNWFIGIRTPWTLSSDIVWEKTHNLGSKLFKFTAVLVMIGAFFKQYSIYFILIPVFSVIIYIIVYSYLEYKKL